MKNLLLLFVFSLSVLPNIFATGGPTALFKNNSVEAMIESGAERNYILFSSYNNTNKMMDFILENPVTMVQIFKEDGTLEMMVPIMSDEVSIGLAHFEKGKYKVGFLIEGVDKPQFMDLTVK